MKRFYEEPLFDVNKFCFDEILSDDVMSASNLEGDLGEDGGNVDGDPLA